MTEAIEYGLAFAALAVFCIAEGAILLAVFFSGLTIRAVWSKLSA